MAAPDSPSPAIAVSPSAAEQTTKIDALGFKVEMPMPRWAVACLAVVIIVGIAGSGAYYSATKLGNKVLIPAAQNEVYEESSFHSTQPATLKVAKEEAFDTTTVTVNYFKSDGCVQIVRYDSATAKGEGFWMFGAHPHTAGHSHETKAAFSSPRVAAATLLPSSTAGEGLLRDDLELVPVQGGRCWDPHPGAFSVMNQPVNQCLVQVWRTFYDGCVHYQMYNPCNGAWDVYPNGAPRVTWTHCVH